MHPAPPPLRPVEGGYALGLDVGGTKVAGGIVDLATGGVAARRQFSTDYARGGAAVLADCLALASDLRAEAKGLGLGVTALGLGVAELVDRRGRVFSDHRIAWSGLDVAGALGRILPATVSADVRAAALAEARLGAGRGVSDFYYVTIGTGVSGALVLDGLPYAGARGAALVIANSRESHRCPACGQAYGGMIEDIASGPGLAAAAGLASAEAVLAAAEAGDARARAAIEAATAALGRVLALLCDGLDPEVLVVGGGLGCAPGRYFDGLAAAVRAGLWNGVPNPLRITQARMGPDAGLIGAALATRAGKTTALSPQHSN